MVARTTLIPAFTARFPDIFRILSTCSLSMFPSTVPRSKKNTENQIMLEESERLPLSTVGKSKDSEIKAAQTMIGTSDAQRVLSALSGYDMK